MPAWLLLAALLAAWSVWVFACAAQAAVADARRGIPTEQRRGVSILPGMPLFPLAFWGLALLVDHFATPWGTLVIGGLHGVLAAVWGASIFCDVRRLRALDSDA